MPHLAPMKWLFLLLAFNFALLLLVSTSWWTPPSPSLSSHSMPSSSPIWPWI